MRCDTCGSRGEFIIVVPILTFDAVHPRSRRIAAEEAEQHGASNTDKRRLLAASAMMFNHSLETEDMVYAGDDFGTWV